MVDIRVYEVTISKDGVGLRRVNGVSDTPPLLLIHYKPVVYAYIYNDTILMCFTIKQ